MVDALNKSNGVGICTLINSILWIVLCLWSVFLIKGAHQRYREAGGTAAAKREFAKDAIMA